MIDKKRWQKLAGIITEEALVSESGNNFKILYHIGPRPPRPMPKRKGGMWNRHWLDAPVESAVFMSDNWKGVWQNHGIFGNVYMYRVPWAAIKDSGGLHKFDWAKEIVIPKSVWEKYNLQNARLHKTIDKDEASKIINSTSYHYDPLRLGRRDPTKFVNFEKLVTLESGKLQDILKFMKPEEITKVISGIEAWLTKISIDGLESEINPRYRRDRLKKLTGLKAADARLNRDFSIGKVRKKIKQAQALKKVLMAKVE